MKSILMFISYPPALKILCVRVLLLAVYYKLLIKFRKFSSIAGRLGTQGKVTPEEPLSEEQRKQMLQLQRAIRAVVPRLHLSNECLVCAFIVKRILRDTPLTIYMGVAKKKNGGMRAHAWTRVGDMIITGEGGRERFTVTATFA